MLIDRAQSVADEVVAQLAGMPGVHRIVQAGSLRRRRETVGDLDLLVETDDPDAVIARFLALARWTGPWAPAASGPASRCPGARRSTS